MEEDPKKLVYTPEEARVLLGVSRSVIYSSLARNLIPHLKVGRRYLIPKHQFHVWLDGSSATTLSPDGDK